MMTMPRNIALVLFWAERNGLVCRSDVTADSLALGTSDRVIVNNVM